MTVCMTFVPGPNGHDVPCGEGALCSKCAAAVPAPAPVPAPPGTDVFDLCIQCCIALQRPEDSFCSDTCKVAEAEARKKFEAEQAKKPPRQRERYHRGFGSFR